MTAQGVLGVILLVMMIVWSALLIASARRDLKTKRIEFDNALEYRRVMRAWAAKYGLDNGGEQSCR